MNGASVLLADEWDYPLDLSSGIPAKQKLFLLHLSAPLKSDFKSDLQLFSNFFGIARNLTLCFEVFCFVLFFARVIYSVLGLRATNFPAN